MTIQASRRSFLKGAAATGAALIVGVTPGGTFAAGTAAAEINPFVRIGSDGVVHVVIKHFEMGQGTTTGLATLVAEELDADWETLAVDLAPGDSNRYANLFFGSQGTGGSTAIANSFVQYRQAGAAARAVLIEAAAETWGVPADAIRVEKGILKSGDRSAHFGELVEKAATLTPPAEPKIKEPSEFRLIGMDGLPRKDSLGKTVGATTFALDVKVPGMVHAVILHAPRFGAKLTEFDAGSAGEIPGFIDAKALPNAAGVVVYARNTWAAVQARDVLEATWDFSEAENRSSDEMIAYHQGLLDVPELQAKKGADLGATSVALQGADSFVEAEFLFPNLAHAPMEPLNCVIEPTENGVKFHDGCQFPGITQPVIAQVLGLAVENVEVNTVYAGGSFGRRATPLADYQMEAAMAFDLLGRQTPVKLIWTREDDIKGGYYRPMAAHRAKIGLKNGRIIGWDHRIAVKSILKGGPFESVLVHDGIDHVSVEGIEDTHYSIPALSVGLTDAQTPVTVLWWRSVGHTHTAYAMETLVDMVAEQAGEDPVAFRLGLLSEGTPDQQRLSGVLQLAAERAGWDEPLVAGRGRGVAVHKSFNSYVAQVAEVSITDGAVKIERITCAVDCGVAVNPDIIRAQMEGGIGYGLGAIMRNQITFTEGEVDQSNFPDYEPLRISDMPSIDVHIMISSEPPTGVGEPGVPPVGPALANAIYAATGKRVTRLPMTESGVEFV